jgi:hypothetical protein
MRWQTPRPPLRSRDWKGPPYPRAPRCFLGVQMRQPRRLWPDNSLGLAAAATAITPAPCRSRSALGLGSDDRSGTIAALWFALDGAAASTRQGSSRRRQPPLRPGTVGARPAHRHPPPSTPPGARRPTSTPTRSGGEPTQFDVVRRAAPRGPRAAQRSPARVTPASMVVAGGSRLVLDPPASQGSGGAVPWPSRPDRAVSRSARRARATRRSNVTAPAYVGVRTSARHVASGPPRDASGRRRRRSGALRSPDLPPRGRCAAPVAR